MKSVPDVRIHPLNHADIQDGEFILYWMVGSRRVRSNFALQRAVDVACARGVPLLILEALRIDYPWVCRRFHQFVVEGMRDNQAAVAGTPAYYHPYLEPKKGAAKGLVEALAKDACLIVTDDAPMLFLPRMQASLAKRVSCRVEAVDSTCLYPMRATERVFNTAQSFRRHLQKELLDHLQMPATEPLRQDELAQWQKVPGALRRWPAADLRAPAVLKTVPSEPGVGAFVGGAVAAQEHLRRFLDQKLKGYHEDRNQPEEQCQSFLSPYLHWGHISVHEIFQAVVEREEWCAPDRAPTATGSRNGWWGMSAPAEAFLDELITWRELSHNGAMHMDDYTSFASLPVWAKETLNEHASDTREHVYTLDELDRANTHDALWNAAQTQLRREGTIHNYLRMLWGKKILEWSPSPEKALEVLIELNNKYAVDGRDANSYSGIFWTLGRYDRGWTERSVFGKVRYMSSDNTARKVHVKEYVKRYSREPAAPQRE